VRPPTAWAPAPGSGLVFWLPAQAGTTSAEAASKVVACQRVRFNFHRQSRAAYDVPTHVRAVVIHSHGGSD
jgi:hypothetical protein